VKKLLFFVGVFFLLSSTQTQAYYTNQSASVVIGQPDFTTKTLRSASPTSLNSNLLSGIVVDPLGRLIVTDGINHRVLIWNSIPTSNGTPADLVLGQPNLTSSTANNGGISARTMNTPSQVTSDGTHLVVVDNVNNRVLIWNTFPTTNQQAADVVVGQSSFSASSSTCDSVHMNLPFGVALYNGKLLVANGATDTTPNRVMIWNTIPTSNGVPADLVLGQPNLSTCGLSSTAANTFHKPGNLATDSQGRLFLGDILNHRVLIWNSIPTTNNQPADVVVGQPDFTSNSVNQGGSVGANTLNKPGRVFSNGSKLFIGDNENSRVVIFNSIPTSNNASADVVLGQVDFTHSSINQGNTNPTANTLGFAHLAYEYGNQLFVGDPSNNRILIFNNDVVQPKLSVKNTPESQGNGVLQLKGQVSIPSLYTVKSVEYSVNGGSWYGATPADGSFNTSDESFSFNFDPQINALSGDGYVVRVRATNSNLDQIDQLLFFQPFKVNLPEENTRTSNSFPNFSFSTAKQRTLLGNGLQKYVVMVKRTEDDWRTYIDEVPVDFESAKDSDSNSAPHTSDGKGNGIYEDKRLRAEYSEDGSRISVYAKGVDEGFNPSDKYLEDGGKKLRSGVYQWKVQAVDKTGHVQETETRTLKIAGAENFLSNIWFPLQLDYLTGNKRVIVANFLPSFNQSLTTSTDHPIFSGKAFVGSTVTLKLTTQNCTADCEKTFTTITNANSEWGINLPIGSILAGKLYSINLSVQLNEQYSELDTFTLKRK
jgi:hypothetical protein